MGRSPDEVIATFHDDQKAESNGCYGEMRPRVEGLRALRQIVGKAQADIALALNITQPSVSKIEKQTDMHLSTLRSYVEAVGGELVLTVKLPKRPALRIHHLGEFSPVRAAPARKKSGDPSRGRRHG